jgi:hypothetical protein
MRGSLSVDVVSAGAIPLGVLVGSPAQALALDTLHESTTTDVNAMDFMNFIRAPAPPGEVEFERIAAPIIARSRSGGKTRGGRRRLLIVGAAIPGNEFFVNFESHTCLEKHNPFISRDLLPITKNGGCGIAAPGDRTGLLGRIAR